MQRKNSLFKMQSFLGCASESHMPDTERGDTLISSPLRLASPAPRLWAGSEAEWGNQNWAWANLEENTEEAVRRTSLLGYLASQKVLPAVDLLATLRLKLIHLQSVVGGLPEIGENRNTSAVLIIFSESHESRLADWPTLRPNMT